MVTGRKKTILNLIVEDYIDEATPIASEAIARKHGLGVSPATIRNEVADLEQEGYITRPHPSAGSVPADRGYRVYVETAVAERENQIPPGVRASIRQQLIEVEPDVDEWANVAAAALSGLVGNMAIATFPKARESRVRHIELVYLQDFLALLIVVLEQARIRRQLIRTKVPASPNDLQMSANKVNDLVQGLTTREIESKQMALSPFEEELISAAVLMLQDEDRAEYLGHYVDGLRNLLAQPEFAENERVRAVVEGVEDGSLAQAILQEVPDTGVVRVIIGQENRGDMLWPLSVVIGRYGISGVASGAVGAIGPVRMEYTKTIDGVELMSGVMSELVEGVHGG